VVNVGAATANVNTKFYDTNGALQTPVGTVQPPWSTTLTQGASFTLDQRSTTSGLPDGFKGSVVVESDQKLASVANVTASTDAVTGIGAYDSYIGVGNADATTQQICPVILRNATLNNADNSKSTIGNSILTIQNAGAVDANGSLTFRDSNGNVATPAAGTASFSGLKPGQSKSFDIADAASGLPNPFFGSVVIVSTNGVPLAAVVEQVQAPTQTDVPNVDALVSYTCFGDGATGDIYAPLIFNLATPSIRTGVFITNFGAADATVSAVFTSAAGATQNLTIPTAGPNKTVLFDTAVLPVGTFGSIKFNSPTQKVSVLVQELTNDLTSVAGYRGLPAVQAATTLYLPIIFSNVTDTKGAFRWYTSFTLVNPNASAATVTLDFILSPALSSLPAFGSQTFSGINVPAGQQVSVDQRPGIFCNPGSDSPPRPGPNVCLTKQFFGTVKITSSNGVSVGAIANQQGVPLDALQPTPQLKDALSAYNGLS